MQDSILKSLIKFGKRLDESCDRQVAIINAISEYVDGYGSGEDYRFTTADGSMYRLMENGTDLYYEGYVAQDDGSYLYGEMVFYPQDQNRVLDTPLFSSALDMSLPNSTLAEVGIGVSDGMSMNDTMSRINELFFTKTKVSVSELIAMVDTTTEGRVYDDLQQLRINLIEMSNDGKVSNFAWATYLEQVMSHSKDQTDRDSLRLITDSPFLIQSFFSTVVDVLSMTVSAICWAVGQVFAVFLQLLSGLITLVGNLFSAVANDQINIDLSVQNYYVKGPPLYTAIPTWGGEANTPEVYSAPQGDVYTWYDQSGKFMINGFATITWSPSRFTRFMRTYKERLFGYAPTIVDAGGSHNQALYQLQLRNRSTMETLKLIDRERNNDGTIWEELKLCMLRPQDKAEFVTGPAVAKALLFDQVAADILGLGYEAAGETDQVIAFPSVTVHALIHSTPRTWYTHFASLTTDCQISDRRLRVMNFIDMLYSYNDLLTDGDLTYSIPGSAMAIRNLWNQNYGAYGYSRTEQSWRGGDFDFSSPDLGLWFAPNSWAITIGFWHHQGQTNIAIPTWSEFMGDPERVLTLPTEYMYHIPDFDPGQVIAALVVVAASVAAVSVAGSLVAGRIAARKQMKQTARVGKLNDLRQKFLEHPDDPQTRQAYNKALRSYNFKARLLGWGGYDAGNGWANSSSSASGVLSSDLSSYTSLLDVAERNQSDTQDAISGTDGEVAEVAGSVSDLNGAVSVLIGRVGNPAPTDMTDLFTLIAGPQNQSAEPNVPSEV